MEKIGKMVKYIVDSDYRFLVDANHGKYNSMSDNDYVRRKYRAVCKKELNLEEPKTFSEKLQWLKLYDRQKHYAEIVDKYEVKEHIAKVVGPEYVIPTLGVWDSFDDIDFDALPQQFVLKCTHDSASCIICQNKSQFDKQKAKKKLESALKSNFYYRNREWQYYNVKPRIIAEVYLMNSGNGNADVDVDSGALTDYKFFCFGGIPKVMYISKDRGSNPETDFFDLEFNHLPIRMKDPNARSAPSKPDCFDDMVALAEKLSKNYPHIRVDFYVVNNKIYVGELTLHHCGGFVNVYPEEWDKRLGSWITLPEKCAE